MIRAFITFAIEKPIINHILFIFMLVLAVISYQKIPKEIFPPATLDKISITGSYIGASADVLDKMAVKNMEDELKSISEIDTIDTTIQNGYFNITANIKSGSDNQLVLGDIKDVISNVKRDLPSDMNEPIAKVIIQNFPLLLVAISGDVDTRRLLEVAETLKSKLSNYQNLSGIEIRGDADEEVVISIDSNKLEAYGLSRGAVYSAISSLSSIFPIGTIEQRGNHLFLSTLNGEKDATAMADSIISVAGKRVKLKDIATVEFKLSDLNMISHFNGKKNVSININKTKKGNAIALSKEIKELIKDMSNHYPDVELEVYTDTSIWIKNRLNLVSSNILFGLLLVFFALFLSVNSRIAVVVALGIPASFMITIISAELIGYSLNMLTLLGTLIALGMIVDEAIVVAENIHRHLEMGKNPKEASIDGAVEMFPAVLTATLTTVFAFLPLLIMSGEMGMFMKVLPVMITILLLSSLFEAFYFLPLHSKELYSIKSSVKHSQKSFFWDLNQKIYKTILSLLFHNKIISLLLIVIIIIVSTIGVMKITKFQLFPPFDTTQIYVSAKVDINHKLQETEVYTTDIEKKILQILEKSELASVTSVVGLNVNSDQTFAFGNNLFQIFVNLHEKAPSNIFDKYIAPIFSLEYDDGDMIREKTAQIISKELDEKVISKIRDLKDLNGEKIFEEINIFVPQTSITGHDIEIGFIDSNSSQLSLTLEKIKDKLKSIDGVYDIIDNAKEGADELKLRVNEYGQELGFNERYITQTLRGVFLKSEYSKVFNQTGLLRLKIEDINKDSIENIKSLKISTPDNRYIVRLSEVCDFTYKHSFVKIFKEDTHRIRSVYARVDTKKILSTQVSEIIEPLLEKIKKDGTKVVIKGEEKENKQLKTEMGQAGLIAVFLIFISLVWMFNSLVLPLIVLSSIPLSIFGALIGAKIVGINLTMPGVMGIIGLAGVVVNDGLIMISFIKKSKDLDSVIEEASHRLRPILLTSITTILGLFTLMFFASGQALIIQPMAISLGFGIAWATLLNLYYVPLLYTVIYKIKFIK